MNPPLFSRGLSLGSRQTSPSGKVACEDDAIHSSSLFYSTLQPTALPLSSLLRILLSVLLPLFHYDTRVKQHRKNVHSLFKVLTVEAGRCPFYTRRAKSQKVHSPRVSGHPNTCCSTPSVIAVIGVAGVIDPFLTHVVRSGETTYPSKHEYTAHLPTSHPVARALAIAEQSCLSLSALPHVKRTSRLTLRQVPNNPHKSSTLNPTPYIQTRL